MNIKELEHHKILQIMKYAMENYEFLKDDIKRELNLEETEFNRYVTSIAQPIQGKDEKQYWRIEVESFVNYLEYIELKEARASAKTAKWIAIFAIVISGILALTSIILNVKDCANC